MLEPFRNEPLSDFADPARAAAYREALAKVRRRLGGHWPLIIGGRTVATEKRIVSRNPARPAEVVGTAAAAAAAQRRIRPWKPPGGPSRPGPAPA